MKNSVKALPAPGYVKVLGKTYEIKDFLKKLGFKWDGSCWELVISSSQQLDEILGQLKSLGVDVSDLEKPLGRFIVFRGIAERKVAVDWLAQQGFPQPTQVYLINLWGRLEVHFKLPKLGKDQFKETVKKVEQLGGEYDFGWFKVPLPKDVKELTYVIADITRVNPDLPLQNPTPDDIINAAVQYLQYWRSKATS